MDHLAHEGEGPNLFTKKKKKKKKRRSKSLKRKKEKMAKDYPENNTIVSSQARSIQEVNKAKC